MRTSFAFGRNTAANRSTIERTVGHFKTLLEAVVVDPQKRVQ